MTTTPALGSEIVLHAARLMRLVRQSLDQPAGVRVLSLVDEVGPQTITALAQADNCSQPTMSGIVADLVARGWVSKAPNPADARSCVVALSNAGRTALTDVRRHGGELVAERLTGSGHSPEELATTAAVLRAITEGTS